MANYITNKEHLALSRELEKHHAIFERIWTLSRIRFSEKLETAGVLFNRRGDCIDFFVNPDFWESQNFIQRCFVLSHECMHISLNHGARSFEVSQTKLGAEVSNMAQDIVINHALDERYGFYRDDIDPILPIFNEKTGAPIIDKKTGQQLLSRRWCWTDTVFPDIADMPTDENYEYYYIRLMKKAKEQQDFMKELMKHVKLVDDHEFNQESNAQNQGMPMQIPGLPAPGKGGMPMPGEGEGKGKGEGDGKGEGKGKGEGNSDIGDDEWQYFESEDYSEDFDEIIDKLDRDLSNEDKNTLEKFIDENENSAGELEENDDYGPDGKTQGNASGGNGQGNSAGNGWTFAKKMPVKKRKFEHIITKWAKKKLVIEEVDVDQWALMNRRFASISSDLELPYEIEMDDDKREDDKIDVWFYQDTSGSCGPYKDRFFSIAESMPLEKFNMRMFCFDTKVYETSLESRELKGFGGTHFHILENHIQDELKNNPLMKRYPEAIFVVTDGLGTEIKPAKPENWHWILTPGGRDTDFPSTCNVHDLAKYE